MIKQTLHKAIIEKIFADTIAALGGQVYVWNSLEQPVWNSIRGLAPENAAIEDWLPNYHQLPRLPLIMGREKFGYIAASGAAVNHLTLLRDWLNFTITQEWQKQAITQDALEKYEEINFLYDISQAMACCLTIQEVGSLVIGEINRLLPFSQATILLLNKSSGLLERIPHVNTIVHEGHTDDLPNNASTDDGIIGMVMNTGRAELVNDVDQDQRYLLYRFHYPSLAKSILCVPLKTRQRVVGVIYLDAITTNAYTGKDMTMLLALSFQAALSIENVQFYHDQIILEQERNILAEQLRSDYARELEKSVEARTKEFYKELEERQRAVAILRSQNFILEKIAANHSLKQVLTTILEFVELYADGALGCIMLVETDEEQRRVLRSVAAPSIPDTYCKAMDGMLVGPDIGSCGNSAYWGKLTITPDISIDPKWHEARSTALSHGLRACWSKPIFTNGGEVLGTLAFYYQTPRSPMAQDFDLLERAGHLAQIAIERNLAEKRLRQAKEKAEVASRAKSEFLANMGHDLRTPLNAILGFTQLLLQEEQSPHQVEQLEIINRSGEHLLGMINDILEVSKLEAGKLNVRLGSFNLYDMLTNLRETFLGTARGKQIYLELEIDDQVPQFIISDQEKLQKSLTNLLDNAVKFTDIGGVTLRVTFIENTDIENSNINSSDINSNATGEYGINDTNLPHYSDHYHQLEFRVEDTGIGIAATEINDLFDVFTRSRIKEGGTGLGLAISRRFIDLLGGKIEVQSQVGVGTLFKFQIKVRVDKSNPKTVADGMTINSNHNDKVVSEQTVNYLLDDWASRSLEANSLPSIESESYQISPNPQLNSNYHNNVVPMLPSMADLGKVDLHWLQEVYRATMQINGNRVNQLLDQLGSEHNVLNSQIRSLVNGFRFDLLLKLFNDFFAESLNNSASSGEQPHNQSDHDQDHQLDNVPINHPINHSENQSNHVSECIPQIMFTNSLAHNLDNIFEHDFENIACNMERTDLDTNNQILAQNIECVIDHGITNDDDFVNDSDYSSAGTTALNSALVLNASVLIIESSLVHRHLLQKTLEHLGYTTKAVSNLAEGKAVLTTDLTTDMIVISFIDLDQLVNAPQFLLDLATDYPQMLLVGLSNLPLTELKRHYKEKITDNSDIPKMFSALNDYLIKPISLDKLTHLIDQWEPLLKL